MTTTRDEAQALFSEYLAAVKETQQVAGRVLTWTDDMASQPGDLWDDLSASMDATTAARTALDQAIDAAAEAQVFS